MQRVNDNLFASIPGLDLANEWVYEAIKVWRQLTVLWLQTSLGQASHWKLFKNLTWTFFSTCCSTTQQDTKSKSWWWQEEPAVVSRLVWSSSFVRSNYNNRWSSASPSNPRRDISTGSSGKWARWCSRTNMIMRWILDGAKLQGGKGVVGGWLASLAVGLYYFGTLFCLYLQ